MCRQTNTLQVTHAIKSTYLLDVVELYVELV